MKKLFLVVSAMFLLFESMSPAWGQRQWPEFDPVTARKFSAKVDDGFGGEWYLFYYNSDSHWGISRSWGKNISNYHGSYVVRRYKHEFGNPRDLLYEFYNDLLKFDARSLPVDAGLGVAFYGYLTALSKANVSLEALIWVDTDTAEVTAMEFRAFLKGNEILLSIPPRCFALYEDIVKKTVKFEIPYGIEDQVNSARNKKYNINDKLDLSEGVYYQFYIDFPAPAEGEPDFLALPAGEVIR